MKQNKKSKVKKPNNRSNSKDYNTNFEGKSVPNEEDVRKKGKSPDKRGLNDVEWYSASTQMLNDAGRISFNNPVGLPLRYGTNTPAQDSVPGIMTLSTVCGPGFSDDNNSAVNLAARNIYTFVRHVNSGASNYEAVDLMMYILAIDSAYQLYSHLVRAYGIALQYKQSNRYYPEHILNALGFDADDIQSDLPRFRFIINKFVRKIGSRPVPGNLNILKRHAWMYSNIFKDANSSKAQLYMYVPAGFHFYSETKSADAPASLAFQRYEKIPNIVSGAGGDQRQWSLKVIEDLCNFMADKILSSEDLGIISGDIVKAYGQNVFTLSEIGDVFEIEPVHQPEVLKQIHNCYSVGLLKDGSINITQDTSTSNWGALIFAPFVEKGYAADSLYHNHIIDSDVDAPDPAEIMVSTRLMAGGGIVYEAGNVAPLMGTEYVEQFDIWYLSPSGSLYNKNLLGSFNTDNQWNHYYWSKFDWAPQLYRETYNNEGEISGIFTFGDIDNYTLIENETLRKLHETAILSEWDVPETAFYKS